VPVQDLPTLINSVQVAFRNLGDDKPAPAKAELVPAVAIKKSVTPEFIVCLEDGKKLKMLKRHLKTVYDMTPDEYRAKWGLPPEYPMVAPNYAKARSEMATKLGLGRKRAAAE
jgi:predicted transcriptional regulator